MTSGDEVFRQIQKRRRVHVPCGAPPRVHHIGQGCAPGGYTPPRGMWGNPAEPSNRLARYLRILVFSQVRAFRASGVRPRGALPVSLVDVLEPNGSV